MCVNIIADVQSCFRSQNIPLSQDQGIETVALQRTYENERWEELFPIALSKSAAAIDILSKFEKRLARFCYSPISLAVQPER
jgi:hypothetical protein